MVVRRIREDDLDQFREVVRAALDLERQDLGEVAARLWFEKASGSGTGLVAVHEGSVVGVLMGEVVGTRAYLNLICVRPTHRRRGIGRDLLREWEREASERGAESLLIEGNPVAYAWPGIDIRYTSAICLALSAGYRRSDIAYDMEVTARSFRPWLEGRTKRLASHSIVVRRAVRADAEELDRYLRSEWTETWAFEAAQALQSEPTTAHLATRGDEIVGFAVHGVGWPSRYGPIGTSASVRGLGVGDALSRLCLTDMAEAGVDMADITWVAEEAIPFYSGSVEARLARCFWLFEKATAPVTAGS